MKSFSNRNRSKIVAAKTVFVVIAAITAFALYGCDNIRSYKDYSQVLAYQQTDSRWGDYVAKGTESTIATTGCGLLSVMNGVRYLTGKEIDIKDFADYMAADNAYTSDGGTWRYIAFKQGGTAEKYFTEHPEYNIKFTKYWGGGECGASAMDSYLDNGSVCIIHIKGHFMCVVAHDSATKSYFLLDSAATPVRETSAAGTWMYEKVFDVKYCCGIDDGFCAITTTGEPVERELPPSDYDLKRTVLTLEVYGKGTARFADTDSVIRVGTVEEKVLIKVKPGFGHKVSSVIVGSKGYRILNGGKEATYQIEQPYNDEIIYISFI